MDAAAVEGIPKPAPGGLISTGVQTEIALHHQAPNHREYNKYKEEEHDNDTKDPSASSNQSLAKGQVEIWWRRNRWEMIELKQIFYNYS